MEILVEIPREVLVKARKYKIFVKAPGAPLDFRLTMIACCVTMYPRQGHFILKQNGNNYDQVSLRMAHRGLCVKTATIKEVHNGLLIRIDGNCTCEPKPSIAEVIRMKIEFVKLWQQRMRLFNEDFLGALRSVGQKWEHGIRPFMSTVESQILMAYLEKERFELLANMLKPKLLGGDESSQVLEETTTTTKVQLEGPVFELFGVKVLSFKFLHQRPTVTTTTTTRRVAGANPPAQTDQPTQ